MDTQTTKANSVLNFFSLSDEYERKARFLPAVLTVLVLFPVAWAFGIELMQFVSLLLTGVGVGAVLAVAISHCASAMGNRMQRKLWPRWPHDSPTHQWLHPSDQSRSTQQKESWWSKMSDVTGLDIRKVAADEDPTEVERTISDAIASIRSRLFNEQTPAANLVRLRNIEYGYARNLTGLRPVWITFAALSCVGCWIAWWKYSGTPLWPIVSTGILFLLLLLGTIVLPQYVRQKAEYYSEAFYSALESLGRPIQ